MTVALSPLFVGYQILNHSGLPNAGGFIYVYQAGTSTPATTYTDSSGTIANTNPIQLNSAGYAPYEIWVPVGASYKFVIEDAFGSVLGTYDNIQGINDGTYSFAVLLAANNTWSGSNTYTSGTTQNFGSATVLVSGATSGTAQPVQAQQLNNDSLPIHATSGPGATSFALRNRIINGNLQINQRAYVSGTALTSGTYAHDRWKAGASGCTYTFTQAANGQQITITSGSLEQVIENANIEGGTYTLSWTGTAQGSVNGGTAATSPITVTGLAASAAVTISFGTGTLGTVQFEAGPTATPFERRPIGLELSLCQRYYAVGPLTLTAGGNGGFTNVYSPRVAFPVIMRAVPTVTTTDNVGNVGKVTYYNGGVETDNATPTIASLTNEAFCVQAATGNTTTSLMAFSYTANSEL